MGTVANPDSIYFRIPQTYSNRWIRGTSLVSRLDEAPGAMYKLYFHRRHDDRLCFIIARCAR